MEAILASARPEARRLRRLRRERVLGIEVPVAETHRSRLLGLALLAPTRAGRGLLVPRCRAVHTFGMRFPLDLVFLDRHRRPLRWVLGLGPCRFAAERRAGAVLELPSAGPSAGSSGEDRDAA